MPSTFFSVFQKMTEKTSKSDLDLVSKRYRDLLNELGK